MAFRTDLAVEAVTISQKAADKQQIRQSQHTIEGFEITETEIISEAAAKELGKPCGRYQTFALQALLRREENAFPRACHALSMILQDLLPESIADSDAVLIVGLGNRMITPDSLGPEAVRYVIATRHLREQAPDLFSEWRPVSAFAPGVLGQTGIESSEVISGLLRQIQPSAVFAIDALAAGQISRLLRTIQLSDTGIIPGSGIGNSRSALNRETLGVPVIAIGVPTVIDGSTLHHTICQQLEGRSCETLQELERPLMLTSQNIDREISDIARLIGYAVNMALHPGLTVEDIDLYLN